MNRVLVIGCGGSGKTTFARRLSHLTHLPLIHLDTYYWLPKWRHRTEEEWSTILRELLEHERWIMDGNYGGSLEERLEVCDTVFFLDRPRGQCLRRVLWRQFLHWGQRRPEMPPGCREKLDLAFLAWIWTYPKRRRLPILERLEAIHARKQVIVLRSDEETEDYLSHWEPSARVG